MACILNVGKLKEADMSLWPVDGSLLKDTPKELVTCSNYSTPCNIPSVKVCLPICRCLTTDSLPRGYSGQYVRASAYAELDGERKRQSIYPGLDPRSLIE